MVQDVCLRNGSMGLRGIPSAITYCPTEGVQAKVHEAFKFPPFSPRGGRQFLRRASICTSGDFYEKWLYGSAGHT